MLSETYTVHVSVKVSHTGFSEVSQVQYKNILILSLVVFLCVTTTHFLEMECKDKMNKQMRRLKYQPIEDYDGKQVVGEGDGRESRYEGGDKLLHS